MNQQLIIVGHEESQAVTKALRDIGHIAYSCDLKPCSGGHPEWHIQGNILDYIPQPGKSLNKQVWMQNGDRRFISNWDAGIFFPDCTYLTISAEWAYKDPDYDRYPEMGYHQKLKPGTLVGKERREARRKAVDHVKTLWNCGIPKIAIENPVGRLSSLWKKPSQTIQPYQFGDNASKRTCLWIRNLPLLAPTKFETPRLVNNKPRYENQTDSGQNNLSPDNKRAENRSKTYPGIANAMAKQWFLINTQTSLF